MRCCRQRFTQSVISAYPQDDWCSYWKSVKLEWDSFSSLEINWCISNQSILLDCMRWKCEWVSIKKYCSYLRWWYPAGKIMLYFSLMSRFKIWVTPVLATPEVMTFWVAKIPRWRIEGEIPEVCIKAYKRWSPKLEGSLKLRRFRSFHKSKFFFIWLNGNCPRIAKKQNQNIRKLLWNQVFVILILLIWIPNISTADYAESRDPFEILLSWKASPRSRILSKASRGCTRLASAILYEHQIFQLKKL